MLPAMDRLWREIRRFERWGRDELVHEGSVLFCCYEASYALTVIWAMADGQK